MEYVRIINGLEVRAEYSERSVQTIFLPLLRGLTAMQQQSGRRILVMLAAPPAAGKSTLVSFLQELSETTEGIEPVTAVGMDGFHRYQQYLLTHTVLRNGEEIPMVKVKGSPVSFDLEALTERIRRVRTEENCPWPLYDRKKHDPVEGAVTVSGNIVLLEGNYLLLDRPGWRELAGYADYTVRILAEEQDVRERLIVRKAASGMPRAEAEAFVEGSDVANVRECLAHSLEADLTLRMTPSGEYVYARGALPPGTDVLRDLLRRAEENGPLWLPDLRGTFAALADGVRMVLRLHSFDGGARDCPLCLPRWQGAEEREFVRDYLSACVFNLLSVCGGREVCFFLDPRETEAAAMLRELDGVFQLSAEKRAGLGKVVSIASRMGRAFGCGAFRFTTADIGEYRPLPPAAERTRAPLAETLRVACAAAETRNCCGVDVGGTDIKLTAAARGKLVAVKEYDWNPALSPDAEGIRGPVLLLIRLMRACIAAEAAGLSADDPLRPVLSAALRKDAPDAEMRTAVAAAEAALDTNVLDAVGVSFPDVVIRDRIVGGETPKTDGMRRNPALDYEAAFARLGLLKDDVLALCRPGGRCRITNDGNVAALTAAAELACGEQGAEAVRGGVIAHTLGTDLGTGVLDADGAIPPMPLELYDVLMDLGSRSDAALPPEDLRSTRNENSGLPGARRYMGQAAAWRLAYGLDPEMVREFVEVRDGMPVIRTAPEDLRKPCLAHLMALADAGKPEAEEVFRRIGLHLAVVSEEFRFLLAPETDLRFLFGRFVKSRRCFALLCEGFARRTTGLRLEAADAELANTPLMRQLAARDDATVAQFGQAVGAIYFAQMEEGGIKR